MSDFTEFDFMMEKLKVNRSFPLKLHEECRGIPNSKKDIIKKLCPFMPLNRVPFWEQLKAADGIADLITEDPFI